MPGPQDAAVDHGNDDRPPLPFVSGSEDHLVPPGVQRSNARHSEGATTTEVEEDEGCAHLLPAQQGRQQTADHVLDWVVRPARPQAEVAGAQ